MNDEEVGAWEHRVRQLESERVTLFELNRQLEADRHMLIEENAALRLRRDECTFCRSQRTSP